jgi:hypothetical protein
MSVQARTTATTVNLGYALSERLRELALEHGRDFAGEARAAVRWYVEQHGRVPAEKTAPAESQRLPRVPT